MGHLQLERGLAGAAGTGDQGDRPAHQGVLELHTCALRAGGAVWCWGNAGIGQLGNGSQPDALTPTAATLFTSGAFAIDAGTFHTCAAADDGVWCWGSGSNGQLGDGTSGTLGLDPVLVTLPP